MKRKVNKQMNDDGIRFDTRVVAAVTEPNYRRIIMSKAYWQSCGSPDPDDGLFRKCVFIGYGAAATKLALRGLDPNVQDIHMTAEFMGYNETQFVIIIKE